MKKIKGVSAKIHEDFYKKMELLRLQLKTKYNINIKSQTQMTEILSKNNSLFKDKKWINYIKKLGY